MNEDRTSQLDCDLAVAVDLTQGSPDSETDSVARMPCTGPEAHSSTLLVCRDNKFCMATVQFATRFSFREW